MNPIRCLACGSEIEPALAALGSMRCSSCRSANARGVNGHALMRVRVVDPLLLGDLEDSLRLSDCLVERESGLTLAVLVPYAHDGAAARRELRVHLAMWRAQRNARVELLG